MKNNDELNKSVEAAMNSLDDVQKASPAPYLLTRINQRLNKTKESAWEKVGGMIGKPLVAIPGLALLILVNVWVIVNNDEGAGVMSEQQASVTADDFSSSVATIYDIENP